ncbi:MAG: hypothetical protein ACREFP_02205 [Acetobacteraceae bacterium]
MSAETYGSVSVAIDPAAWAVCNFSPGEAQDVGSIQSAIAGQLEPYFSGGLRCKHHSVSHTATTQRKRINGLRLSEITTTWSVHQSPRMLLLSDPLRDVDVKAKATIHDLIADLERAGLVVCVAGSDIDEILMLAQRIVCIRGGRIVVAGDRAEFDAIKVLEYVSAKQAA